MNAEEIFIQALKENVKDAKKAPSTFHAVVTQVGETYCKVSPTLSEDLELEGVMYSATEDNKEGFVLIPKVNANVLVGIIGDDENSLFLQSIDEVEKVKFFLGSEIFTIDKSGFGVALEEGKLTIKNNFSDLKILLKDLVKLVQELTVSTAVGASGVPLPPTQTTANEIKESINKLFK